MHSYVMYCLCGVAGFVFQSLAKLSSLQKDARAANIEFDWKRDYLRRDSFSIMMSALAPLIWLLVYDEWLERYNFLEDIVKTGFVVVGAIGSWILQYFFGGAKKWIRGVIDSKTNELDELREQIESLKNKSND